MNDITLHLALTTKSTFYVVASRSTVPSQSNNLPAFWEYSLFPPGRVNLAYKMLNQLKNLPEHFEAHILTFEVPSWLCQRVPYNIIGEI
jgi:hypothetical protein